jgi:von Willebrand factor type A domain
MMRRLIAPLAALTLRAVAVLVLLLALLAPQLLARPQARELIVLLDRSASMPRVATLAAWQALREARPRRTLQTLEFAGRAEWLGRRAPPAAPQASLQLAQTHIARALWSALARAEAQGGAGIALVSDGYSRGDDVPAALRAARAAGVPVCWRPLGRRPPPVRITGIAVASTAFQGRPVTLAVSLQASGPRRVAILAQGGGASAERTVLDLHPGRARIPLTYTPPSAGPLVVSVSVADAASGAMLAPRAEVLLDVRGLSRTLYVADRPGPLAASLREGGWPLERIAPAFAPTRAQTLSRFQVVVLDDVAIRDAPQAFWTALAGQVASRGLGLIVLGGPHAFARGGYRHSALEALLPVVSESGAADRTQAVAFLIDKSGSMGRTSAGVDRLSVARQAVILAARDLSPGDEVALIAFDAAPRLLVPLAPYRSARAALEGAWPVRAAGGTRIAPALAYAAGRLALARSRRRTLVVMTDGYAPDGSEPALSRMLARESIQLVLIAIGADANAAALARLSAATGAQVLRVADVAQLPRFARATIDERRGRVQLGPTQVIERLPTPFPAEPAWAAVTGYAVTRARRGAQLYLVSGRGDPLLASGLAGAGRVLALPAGLGQWARRWPRSPGWPRLAGGLIEWASRRADDPRLGISAADGPDAIAVRAELTAGGDWSARQRIALRLTRPDGATESLDAPATAPGQYVQTLPAAQPGLYTITATAGEARATRYLLHEPRRESQQFGINPALRAEVTRGRLEYCTAHGPAGGPALPPDPGPARRDLAGAALGCLLGALAIDFRARWRTACGRIRGRYRLFLQRARERARRWGRHDRNAR